MFRKFNKYIGETLGTTPPLPPFEVSGSAYNTTRSFFLQNVTLLLFLSFFFPSLYIHLLLDQKRCKNRRIKRCKNRTENTVHFKLAHRHGIYPRIALFLKQERFFMRDAEFLLLNTCKYTDKARK